MKKVPTVPKTGWSAGKQPHLYWEHGKNIQLGNMQLLSQYWAESWLRKHQHPRDSVGVCCEACLCTCCSYKLCIFCAVAFFSPHPPIHKLPWALTLTAAQVNRIPKFPLLCDVSFQSKTWAMRGSYGMCTVSGKVWGKSGQTEKWPS